MPDTRAWRQIASEIDLPPGVATWVLVAHVLTALSPAVLAIAAVACWPVLREAMAWPVLVFPAAALLLVGSVCESAENTQRRWYLTEAGPSLLDWLFNSCVAAFMALMVIACRGDRPWVLLLALALLVAYVASYLLDWPTEPAQAVLGVVYVATLYWVFADPVVFLQLLGVFFTVYFYRLLLATRAQVLHGFTALVNGVGLMALPWAMFNAAAGTRLSLTAVLLFIGACAGLALALRPILLRLPPTPRGE